MNLVIDVGNTQIKLAIFENSKLIFKESFSKKTLINKLNIVSANYKITHAILSSVSKIDEIVLDKVQKLFPLLILNLEISLPFNNKYLTPQTLGVDRIALVAAAVNQYPNNNVLIIDAGTCITYDFIDANKDYYGGAISPGIAIRYKSLYANTSNLPQLSLIDKIPESGNTTQNAMHLGVLKGIIFEIEGVIKHYKAENQKLTVILTGGDIIFLARNIKSTIFANPNFLLEGLNSILTHNIDE